MILNRKFLNNFCNIYKYLIERFHPFFHKLKTIGNYTTLGSSYGGWSIVLQFLNSRSIVYSVGVGEDISFDIALIRKFNLKVHAFDPTPRSIAWIKSIKPPRAFRLHNLALSNKDGREKFYIPQNKSHVSHTLKNNTLGSDYIIVKTKRLVSIMQQLKHTQLDVLKLDIEGSEYDVIPDMLSSKIFPKQLLVEFHHHFHSIKIKNTLDIIRLLKKNNYYSFHISPSKHEFSFIHRS